MKAVDKWMKRLQDHKTPWTEQEIIYFRKALGFCGLKSKDERGLLLAEFEHAPAFRITCQHDVKGQAYMLRKSLKKNGGRRKGCKLSDADLKVFKELDYHLFTGLYAQRNGLNDILGYLPIYRAVSIGGEWVEYVGTRYEQVIVIDHSEPSAEQRRKSFCMVVGAK